VKKEIIMDEDIMITEKFVDIVGEPPITTDRIY